VLPSGVLFKKSFQIEAKYNDCSRFIERYILNKKALPEGQGLVLKSWIVLVGNCF